MRCWFKVRSELFAPPIHAGGPLQVGTSRFRVIGVMAPKDSAGFDLDDTVYIPTARALEVFKRGE